MAGVKNVHPMKRQRPYMMFEELFHYSRRITSEPSRNGKEVLVSESLEKLLVNEALYGMNLEQLRRAV
ncbi:hypothetical protein JXB22_11375 [candidate division WOR-3 bacterium]|nr:hypothetical protein [candidate division WOR-3 bacterium]